MNESTLTQLKIIIERAAEPRLVLLHGLSLTS